MTEPGEAVAQAFRIVSISLKPEDDAKLTKLKRHLEGIGGKRLTTTEVVRCSIDAMLKAEAVK